MPLKTFRFNVDFFVDVEEIGSKEEAQLRQAVPEYGSDAAYIEEVLGRKRRLLFALLANANL